jgi:hypothetical protein
MTHEEYTAIVAADKNCGGEVRPQATLVSFCGFSIFILVETQGF